MSLSAGEGRDPRAEELTFEIPSMLQKGLVNKANCRRKEGDGWAFITILILVAVVMIGFRLLMGKAIKDKCGNVGQVGNGSRLSPTQENPAHCQSSSARWEWNDT